MKERLLATAKTRQIETVSLKPSLKLSRDNGETGKWREEDMKL